VILAVNVHFAREKPTIRVKVDDLFEETLAAQTIRKAAQPLRANHCESRFPGEVAQTLLPKAGSLQRHHAKSNHAFHVMHDLQLPTKEEVAVACSPIADPGGMRVVTAQEGKETLDVDEAKEAS
jgi:hypothetical protein